MPTINDLLTPRDAEGLKTDLLEGLKDRGFPVTAWAEGDVARTLIEIDAEAISNAEQLVAQIAQGGLGPRAQGDWLTLRAREFYGLERLEATFAEGEIQVTASNGASAQTLQPGEVWVRSDTGRRFVNTSPVVVDPGNTTTATVRAESPGAAFNVGSGSISRMVTPLPGVSVDNPGSWLTSPGADAESDESLLRRMQDRWPQIGATGATAAVYRLWAVEAAPEQVRRVQVEGRGDTGKVTVIVAGDQGPVEGGVADAVREYIEERAPLTVSVAVENVVSRSIQVTALVDTEDQAEVDQAKARVEDYILNVPIGGKVVRSKIIALLAQSPVVAGVALSAPLDDIELAPNEAASPVLDVERKL